MFSKLWLLPNQWVGETELGTMSRMKKETEGKKMESLIYTKGMTCFMKHAFWYVVWI